MQENSSAVPSASSTPPLWIPPSRRLRFLTVFAGTYALLHALYFSVPDQAVLAIHYHALIAPCAKLIDALAPTEHVAAYWGGLGSDKARLRIVRGCDGTGLLFLLLSAVFAFPGRGLPKVVGLTGAVLLSYTLNQARLIALYFAMVFRNDWFGLLHNYFLPTFLLLAGGALFCAWACWARRRSPQAAVIAQPCA
jgi:exosortase family protein XrtM